MLKEKKECYVHTWIAPWSPSVKTFITRENNK